MGQQQTSLHSQEAPRKIENPQRRSYLRLYPKYPGKERNPRWDEVADRVESFMARLRIPFPTTRVKFVTNSFETIEQFLKCLE